MKAASALVFALVLGLAGCGSAPLTSSELAGIYDAKGGLNESLCLELKADGTYMLQHLLVGDSIGDDGVIPTFLTADEGKWSTKKDTLQLAPQLVGTNRSAMFLPAHCAAFDIRREQGRPVFISVATPVIPVTSREKIVLHRRQGPRWAYPSPGRAPDAPPTVSPW